MELKTKSIEENLDKEPFDFKKDSRKSLRFLFQDLLLQFYHMMGAGLFKMLYAMLGPDLFNVMNVEHPFMKMISIVEIVDFTLCHYICSMVNC